MEHFTPLRFPAMPFRRSATSGVSLNPSLWRILETAGIWLIGVVALAAPLEGAQLERFEFTRVEMAMPVRIVLYSEREETATAAAKAAFDRIAELNGILSDYDSESELRRLCRTAGTDVWVPVSDDLWRVLDRARQVSEASEGAFDVTIGPVSRLWRRARRRRRAPKEDNLNDALGRVGYRLIEFHANQRSVRLKKGDMQLDLGGIAKGYAIDQALKVLQQKGFRRALVDASGDIGAAEPPPGMPGWRIAIAASDPEAPPVAFLWLKNGAVAHSGDAWQYVEIDGVRYSHLVDPKTGLGLTDRSTVTVVAPDAMTADALASAVSVMGPQDGLTLIEKTPGVAARIVQLSDGGPRSYVSSAWKDLPFAPDPGQLPR